MIQTGRDVLASPVVSPPPLRFWPKAWAEVGYLSVGSTIVTARFGIIFTPALRTVITMWVRSAKRCAGCQLARVTSTGKLPLGSFASWAEPLPHPLTASD